MRRTRKLRAETLEVRSMLASFGVPWHDPSHLSISFVPDGTPIAGHSSELYSALSQQPATGDWQRVILTAFQNWAEQANVNFGWRPDEGQALGVSGFPQGDPRFGDIRIGAHAMSQSALAIAVPPDPSLAGTMMGDILLNSEYAFDGDPYSLLAVMMHEAGHSLGIGNSSNPDAVMFSKYNATRTKLSAEDIGQAQTLYGKRAQDAYEGALGNDTLRRAASFNKPDGYKGETPLVAFGDMTRRGDVDFFKLQSPPDGNDDQFDRSVTIRLQTLGSSLLAPKLTVLDQFGRVLARRTSTSYVGDTLQVQVQGLSSSQQYFVRVEGARSDAFGVGRYGLSVRFDKYSSTSDQVIEKLLRGPFEQLGPAAIDAFFRTNGDVLLNADEGTNDTVRNATPLAASGGYAASRFEAIGSIAQKEDVDFYRLTAPAGAKPVLTASVWTASEKGFTPQIEIYDSRGQAVPFDVLVQAGGTSTVQFSRAMAGSSYFLRVSLAGGASEDKGNYHVSANFGTVATPLAQLARDSLSKTDQADTARLYIAQPQLMQFVLTAGREDLAAKLRLIISGPNGTEVNLVVAAGQTISSGGVLLRPGPYNVRIEIENPSGPAVNYRLKASRLSDPIGPVPTDPTLAPQYELPPDPEAPSPEPDPTTIFVYPNLPLPYDPETLTGYYDPLHPENWPYDTSTPDLSAYDWVLLSLDPFYFVAID